MWGYPKWHETAENSPMRLIQDEIDALRKRLDDNNVGKRISGSSSPGDGSGYPTYGEDSETAARERYEAMKAGNPLPWPPLNEQVDVNKEG